MGRVRGKVEEPVSLSDDEDSSFANPLAGTALFRSSSSSVGGGQQAGGVPALRGSGGAAMAFELEVPGRTRGAGTGVGGVGRGGGGGGDGGSDGAAQRLREACTRMARSDLLEQFAIAAALGNSVVLALDSPAFPPAEQHASALYVLEVLVTMFFTLECCVKVVDMGLLNGREAYLRRPSHRLDFVVVVSAWAGLFIRSNVINALRTLRTFRLVPALKKLGTINAIVMAVWNAGYLFRDILGLMLFAIFTFSIVGVNFFAGMLSYTPLCEPKLAGALLSGSSSGSTAGSAPDIQLALQPAFACPVMIQCAVVDETHGGAGDTCVERMEPLAISDKEHFGYHGFDNVLQAGLTIFVQMTCDGGMQDVPHMIEYGLGETAATLPRALVWPFFLCLVVVCGWVVLPLFTAVLSAEFRAVRELERLEQAEGARVQAEEEVQRQESASESGPMDNEDPEDSPSLPPLSVVPSAGLVTDTRFDVIVNSVSPEFGSSASDSGINRAVWAMLTSSSGTDGSVGPPAIHYDTSAFSVRNGAPPTYGDCLWSELPQAAHEPARRLRYIVHALAPDRSNRPKRLNMGLGRAEARAVLFAVYYRAIWQAAALGGPSCTIGLPPLGGGVFANERDDVCAAAVLAFRAYRESGGRANVCIGLYDGDDQLSESLDAWQQALVAGELANTHSLSAEILAMLAPQGSLLLRQVPPVHTETELKELLESSDDPRAAEFLIIRDDETQALKLTQQLADGKTWAPLLSQLVASAQRPPPFTYPQFPASAIGANLLLWLNSEDFLHFKHPHSTSVPCQADQSALPHWLVQRCTAVADSKKFTIFIAGCIFLSVVMLFDFGDRRPKWVLHMENASDSIFIIVFFAEFVIKVIAYKWTGYWADGTNRLDFAILIITGSGFIVSILSTSFAGDQATQSFLSLRLPRLLRLARLTGMMRFLYLIDSVKAVFETVFSAWQNIASLCLFLCFMQGIFSLFGMQLLGGSLPQGTQVTSCWGGLQNGCGAELQYTRRNVETFPRALLTSFQYMTGESWSQIMFWYAHHGIFGRPGAYAFFVLLFIWQFLISIALFVAILLDKFALSEEEKMRRQVELYERKVARDLGASDPYVAINTLGQHHHRHHVGKTPVVKNCLDPVWESDNAFEIHPHENSGKLVLTVMDRDFGTADDFLGEVRIDWRIAPRDADSQSNQNVLHLSWNTEYQDMNANIQTSAASTIRDGSDISDVIEVKLSQGPDWTVDGTVQGKLTFWLRYEEHEHSFLKHHKSTIHITILSATNLMSEGFTAPKAGEHTPGIIALAFPGEFEEMRQQQQQVLRAHKHAEHTLHGRDAMSLYMFGPSNPFRRLCVVVVDHPIFDAAIVGCILFSCCVLAWEGPPGKLAASGWEDEVNLINAALCAIFVCEAAMKIVAAGFIQRADPKRTPYLQSALNCVDFFVVSLISAPYIVHFVTRSDSEFGTVGRTLRIFRVMSPIRIVLKSDSMKTILRSFLLAAPAVGAVFGVLLMFMLMAAIVGTELFRDCLRRCCLCSDPLTVVRQLHNGTEIFTKAHCLSDPTLCWDNPGYNFDTTLDSMQTLFKTMTAHGWVDIMESVADSNGADLQPSKDAQPLGILYFVVFHIVITFFMLNLLVGVLASSFSEANNTNLYTKRQKEWVREKNMLTMFSPKQGTTEHEWTQQSMLYSLRNQCKAIADNVLFQQFIVVAILANVLNLALEHYPMSIAWHIAYVTLNTIFLAIFTLECAINILGYGVKNYMQDPWNVMDIVVVGGSWLSLLAGMRSGLEVMRVLRVFRVFLVVNHFEGLMALYSTVIHSLPSAIDVCVIGFLVFYIYAIIGMSMFGDMHPQQCDVECAGRFNLADNFSNFFHAIRLLFQTTAAQSFYNLTYDLQQQGGRYALTFLYFASFKFLSDYVFINLVVGIILDTFDNTFSTEDSIFHADDLWTFREKWREQAIVHARNCGVEDTDLAKIAINPGKVPLPLTNVHAILGELVNEGVIRVAGDIMEWRCYFFLQMDLFAREEKKRKLSTQGMIKAAGKKGIKVAGAKGMQTVQRVQSVGSTTSGGDDGVAHPVSPEDSPSAAEAPSPTSPTSPRSTGRSRKKWVKLLPPGIRFQPALRRLVLFELGKNAMLYSEKIRELEAEKRCVSAAIVRTTVRAWMWVSISRSCPVQVPAIWRTRLPAFRVAVIGMRNSQLSVLFRLMRFIDGRAQVVRMDRLQREDEDGNIIVKSLAKVNSVSINSISTKISSLQSSASAMAAKTAAVATSARASTAGKLNLSAIVQQSPSAQQAEYDASIGVVLDRTTSNAGNMIGNDNSHASTSNGDSTDPMLVTMCDDWV